MTIKLQCSLCGKKIEAPDSAGGKWGKCPACRNKIYVPQPISDDDELKLAPIDQTEGTTSATTDARNPRGDAGHSPGKECPRRPRRTGPAPGTDITEEKLTDFILRYLRQMANGDTRRRTAYRRTDPASPPQGNVDSRPACDEQRTGP